MSHQYTLQLHTGTFSQANYTFQEIQTKCDVLLEHIHGKDIIIGWNSDKAFNRQIIDYFHQKGLRVLLWLPVMANNDELCAIKKAESCNGEINKDFGCPSHLPNAHEIISLYERYFADLPFDGVFLDKIRFASFSQGYEAGFGCFCPSCEQQLEGVSLDYIKTLIKNHDKNLMRGEYDRYGRYHFADYKVNAFYKQRARIVSDLVFRLAAYFNSRKLVVGADLFAPILAYHVGQNIKEIAEMVDFVKPMMYTHTQAPCGIPYEYEAYIRNFAEPEPFTKHFPGGPLSNESLRTQLEYIANLPANIVPGIEINVIQGVCHTDSASVQDHLKLFSRYPTVALCWNIMQISDDIINVL